MAKVPKGVGKAIKSFFEPEGALKTEEMVVTGKESPADPLIAQQRTEEVITAGTDPSVPRPEGHRTDMRNVNLDRLDVPEEYEKAIDAISQQTDNAGYQRKSIDEMKSEYDLDEDELVKRLVGGKKRDSLLTGPQLLKARESMVNQVGGFIDRSDDYVRRLNLGEISDMDRIEMQRDLWRTTGLQSAVQGEVREMARAFRLLQEHVGPINSMELDSMIKSGGSDIDQKMRNINAASKNGKTAADRLKNTAKAISDNGWWTRLSNIANAAVGWRTVQLLWSPLTHVRNIVGNSITNLAGPVEHGFASVISRTPLIGSKEMVGGEMSAMFRGDMGAWRDGLRLFGKSFAENETIFGRTKLDEAHYNQVPQDVSKYSDSVFKKAWDVFMTVTMAPGRALVAEDEFFKVMAFRSKMQGAAHRIARKEGLTGGALTDRIDEIMSGPNQEKIFERIKKHAKDVGDDGDLSLEFQGKLSEEEKIYMDIYRESIELAHYQTFTDPMVTKIGKAGQDLTRNPFVKMIVPFYRTPTNILAFSLERSPLAFIAPQWWRDMLGGGANRDLAIARVTMGSMTAMGIWTLVSDGTVTGSGPQNRALANTYKQAGHRRNSIHIGGGEWVSYQGLDPFSTQMSVLATTMDMYRYSTTDKQRENIAMVVSAAIAESLKERSFMEGLSRFMDALETAQKGGGKSSFFGRMAASALPASGLLRTITKESDGVKRSTVAATPLEMALNQVKQIVPIWSEYLPPQRDMWGKPIKFDDAYGPDLMSPFYMPEMKDDPAARELSYNMVPVARVGSVVGDGNGHRIDTLEMEDGMFKYDELLEAIGTERESMLTKLVNKGFYKNARPGPPDDEDRVRTQGDILKEYLLKATKRGRDKFIKKNRGEIKAMVGMFQTDDTYWAKPPKATQQQPADFK